MTNDKYYFVFRGAVELAARRNHLRNGGRVPCHWRIVQRPLFPINKVLLETPWLYCPAAFASILKSFSYKLLLLYFTMSVLGT